MKKGLGIIYFCFSVLFYLGIVCVLYLYRIDDNTYKWMIAEAMVFFGILISVAIPDMLISIDVDTVSISASRAAIINKYLVFCIAFTLTNKFFWGVTVLVGISMLIGLVIESMLFSQILSADISIRQFTERLNAVDTSVVDGVLKYYGIYILGIVFYLNLHSNIYEQVIMLAIMIAIHSIVVTKVVEPVKCNAKWKIKLVLWLIFLVTAIVASFDYDMVVYSFIGTYVMISRDLLQSKKTSLFKVDYFE